MDARIHDELIKLAARRDAKYSLARVKEQLIKSLLESNENYQKVLSRLDFYSKEIEASEKIVRDLAITEYNQNKEKQIIPKVLTIKEITTVEYEAARAREWCLHNFTPALTLDAKAFETLAKEDRVPADLVTIKKEPKAYIATDLSVWEDIETGGEPGDNPRCICVDFINNNPDPVSNPDCPTHGTLERM